MWYVIIWVLGTLASYFGWLVFLKKMDDYTIRARARNIIAGVILTWISLGILMLILIVGGIIELYEYMSEEIDWNADANW
jgi:hypothetical protein